MAKLTGQTIAASYDQLLIVGDADGITATAQAVESADTGGNASLLYLSTTEVYCPGPGGTSHTAFGKDSGVNLGTGTGNALFGEGAGADLTTGEHNTAIGYRAIYQGTTETDDNVAIGYNAMSGAWTTAAVNDCVVIGSGAGAGALVAGASGATLIGKGAGAALTSGQTNTAVGFMALNAEDTNQQNTAIGYNALLAQNGADSNTAIGRESGKTISTGGDNTLVGTNAALLLTTGARNAVLGAFAFDAAADTESDNVAIGYFAMGSCDQGTHADSDIDENVAIGSNALKGGDITDSEANVTGNVAIGYNAMDGTNTRSATGNTFVGQGAGGGTYGGTATDNVGIGSGALSGALEACLENTAVGNNSLAAVTTGDYNIGIGSNAGAQVVDGLTNVIIGGAACYNMTTGDKNIAIGQDAGRRHGASSNLTESDNSIFIGYNARAESNQNTNEIVIGYDAVGAGSNTATIGDGDITIVRMSDDSGAVVYCSGIQFPASAVASGDANVLDDYEEGGWTAALTDGTNAMGMDNTACSYTKVGKIVYVGGYINASSIGAASGDCKISGLPFTPGPGSAAGNSALTVGRASNLAITAGHAVQINVLHSNTQLQLTVFNETGGTTNLTTAAASGDALLVFAGTYQST